MTKWHKSPPPEIGWWPASIKMNKQALRWWNGKYWSINAYINYTAEEAAARFWGDNPVPLYLKEQL